MTKEIANKRKFNNNLATQKNPLAKVMTKFRNQHFVPRSYLKRFALNSADHQIYVYDKFTRRSFLTNVRNVAAQSGFHDLPIMTDEEFSKLLDELRSEGLSEDWLEENASQLRDSKAVEKMLSSYEGNVNEVLEFVLANIDSDSLLTDDLRLALSEIMVTQFARTSSQRRIIAETLNKTTNEVIVDRVLRPQHPEIDFDDASVRATEEHIRAHHLAHLLNSEFRETVIPYLAANHVWVFGRNRTPRPFYTSDSPVVRRAHVKNRFGNWGVGFTSEGLEINYPLSSEYILITRDHRHFSEHLGHLDGSIIDMSVREVINANRLQVAWSYRQIMCARRDFAEVGRLIRKYPALCSMDRELVEAKFHLMLNEDDTTSDVYHLYQLVPEMEFLSVPHADT